MTPTSPDLRGLVASVVEELSPLAADRQVRIDVRLGAQPLLVSARAASAADALRPVVRHLLVRAIGRSPEGAAVLLDATHEDDGNLELVLRDAGPPLAAAELADTPDGVVGDLPGADLRGLDLAGCRRALHAIGGTLSLSDRPVGGMCLVVHLEGAASFERVFAERPGAPAGDPAPSAPRADAGTTSSR